MDKGNRYAQGLATHLTACFPELGHGLHRLKGLVEVETGGQIFCLGKIQSCDHGNRVTGPNVSFEIGADKFLNTFEISDDAFLNIGLQAIGMRVASGGKKAVGELKQA